MSYHISRAVCTYTLSDGPIFCRGTSSVEKYLIVLVWTSIERLAHIDGMISQLKHQTGDK